MSMSRASRTASASLLVHACLAVLLLCLGGAAAAEVLQVPAGLPEVPVGMQMAVMEDQSALLDIETAASPAYAARYAPVDRARPNFGFRRSAMWLRLQLDFSAVPGEQWHLVQNHPLIDEITWYLPRETGGWDVVEMGDSLPFSFRAYALREFVLPIPAELLVAGRQPVTVFVRFAGLGALNVDLRLANAQGLAESTEEESWRFGLFYGALFVMILYNLFLFAITRERTQLHYLVFLSSLAMLFFSLNGFGLQYLWPDMPAINGWFPVFTCLAVWGGLQFTRNFLELRRDAPRTDNLFRWMSHAVGVIFVLGLLLPRHWAYVLGTVLPLFFALVMLAAGVRRLRQGYAPARLFVAAWGVLLAGSVLLPLANLGLLPINAFTEYSPQFGAVLLVLLLSVAIGERMKLLKLENERIQAEGHQKLAHMFSELQQRDADKMRFLNYLSHELNTPLHWLSAARQAHGAIDAREMGEIVEAGQQRLIDLVAIVMRYFDVAGEDAGRVRLAPVAPMWLADDVLRSKSAAIAGKQLQLVNRIPADLAVLANEQRLRQILDIFIDNAIHFSEPGQSVVLEGGVDEAAGRVLLSVRDQGRGIEAAQLPRLFEPFFMVGSHHREGGFGLSLPTARLLATSMGGDVRAESEGRGLGATFTVWLPLPVQGNASAARTG
jgi:signal transduction histidine kinase